MNKLLNLIIFLLPFLVSQIKAQIKATVFPLNPGNQGRPSHPITKVPIHAAPGCSVYITEPLIKGAYVEALVAATGTFPLQCNASSVRISEVRFDAPCSWLGGPAAFTYQDEPCDDVEAVKLMITRGAENPEYGATRRYSHQADASSCAAAVRNRATSLDKVLSDGSATDGFVFSKGLHCKKEKAGVVFIENRCPGSVVLVFKGAWTSMQMSFSWTYELGSVWSAWSCTMTCTRVKYLDADRTYYRPILLKKRTCNGPTPPDSCSQTRTFEKKAADVVYKLEAKRDSAEDVLGVIPAKHGTEELSSPDIGISTTVALPWQGGPSGSTSGLASTSSGEIRPMVQPPAVFGRALPATAPPVLT